MGERVSTMVGGATELRAMMFDGLVVRLGRVRVVVVARTVAFVRSRAGRRRLPRTMLRMGVNRIMVRMRMRVRVWGRRTRGGLAVTCGVDPVVAGLLVGCGRVRLVSLRMRVVVSARGGEPGVFSSRDVVLGEPSVVARMRVRRGFVPWVSVGRLGRVAVVAVMVVTERVVQANVQVGHQLEAEYPKQARQRRSPSSRVVLPGPHCERGPIVAALQRYAQIPASDREPTRAHRRTVHVAARGLILVVFWLAGMARIASARAAPPEQAAPAAADSAPAEAGDEEKEDEGDVREIRVARQTRALTASGRYIDAKILRNQPKRSAEDLLRLVPGMLIVQHGNQGKGQQFYVRGFDAVHGSDIETTVGDIPLNEPSNVHAHGYLDLAFIPAEAVIGIDARKGSYQLDQANFATAGTIGYQLGVAKPDRGTRIGYEIGSTNRHRTFVVHAPRERPESTVVALEALHDNGYGENRKAQRLSGLAQLRLLDRGSVHLDGLAGAYAARFGLPGLVRLDDYNAGRQGFYDAYTQDTRGESARALVGLTTRVETERTQLSATVYGKGRRLMLNENFTGFLQNTTLGDRHRQVQDAGTGGLRGHVTVRVHDKVQVQLHGNWQGNVIEQRQDELVPTGQIHATSRDLMIHQNTWGFGPGIVATPLHWLTLDGGVRFDVFHDAVQDRLQDNQIFRETFWAASPRVSMRAQVGPRWQLFAAYGRGFRSPDARAITLPRQPPENVDVDVFAGGEPRMTLTDAVEVGSRFRPNRVFDAGASLFGTFIARESVFDHVSGFNVERSGTRRLGVEADVQVHPTDWIDLGADVTAVRGRFTASGAPIPGAPPLIVSTFGNLAHRSGFHAGYRWFLLGPRPLSYGAKAGIVTNLDASIGYRGKHFGLDVAVDNILGLRWREGEYNYASHWDPSGPRSQIPTVHYISGYPRMLRATLTVWF